MEERNTLCGNHTQCVYWTGHSSDDITHLRDAVMKVLEDSVNRGADKMSINLRTTGELVFIIEIFSRFRFSVDHIRNTIDGKIAAVIVTITL